MKKKMLSVLLAAALLLGTASVSALAAELPFTDIPDKAWYRDAVIYTYENGLFQGNSATEFAPNAPMTRAMFVQVLANKTSNYNKADWAGKTSFSDVNASAWYAAPIQWANKAGLVSGVGGGKFAPTANVSREQMATILYNYAKNTGNDVSFDANALAAFPDASAVSNYAREAMQWAVTHKIIKGTNEGKLVPKSNAKRCEVAQVAVNADPVLVKTEVQSDPTNPPDSGKFATVEEFANSDLIQSELEDLKAEMEGSGMSIDIMGKGNKLIYVFAFAEGINTDGLAAALETALDSQASVFTGLAALLKDAVEVDNPVVVVTYTDHAGNTIYSREFTAAQ